MIQILFQSLFLREAVKSSSSISKDVHSLTLSIDCYFLSMKSG